MPRYLTATLTATLLTLLLSSALAQQAWTVQTAAFRDFREAGAVVAQLERLGFDAYSEFTLHQGKQYSRVRVGCFLGRPLAESMATHLRGNITAEAVVTPFTPGAAPTACVDSNVGFRLPESWGIQSREPSGILFWVELSGRRGYLAFNGARWQVMQSEDEAARYRRGGLLATTQAPASAPPAQGVSEGLKADFTAGASQAIKAHVDGRTLTVAYGEILWRSAGTAVIRSGDRITAIRLLPPLE